MKNLIIVALLLALVGLGFYVAKQEGITSVKELAATVEQKVGDTVDSVKNQIDTNSSPSTELVPVSLVGLPADTAFSLVLPGKAIEPAVTHLSNFIVKVKSSSLGKKLEIDKMLDQGLEAAQGGASGDAGFGEDFPMEGNMPSDGMPSDSMPSDGPFGDTEGQQFGSQNPTSPKGPTLEEMIKIVQNFDKLELLVRAKTLEGKATPLIKVNASFKDEAYSKQLQEMLDGFVEMSKEGGGPELKKDAQDPSTYVLNVKPPMAPVEALARLKTGGKDINLTLGLIAGASSAKAASPASNDSVIAQSAVSKDSFSTYLNMSNVQGLIDVALGLIPSGEDKQQVESIRKTLDSSLGSYSAVGVSAIFQNGFNSKSCSKFGVDAKAFLPYKNAIDSAKSHNSQFYKLIGPRTTFAARVDGSFALAFVEGLSETINDPKAAASAHSANPDMAAATGQMFAQLKIAEEEIKKLKIIDMGLLANAPTVSFVPDVGVYFEHEAGLTIDQFGATLQTLFKKLASPSIANTNPITISKDSAGQTQIVLPVMDGYQLSFKSISPTQIFGTIQDNFTDEAKTLLASKEPFVDDAKLSSKGVKLKISENDNFYYISTSSLMPLIRQFTPFITMSKPELKINDTELTQFLDLFDFNLLVTGENTSPEDSMLCTVGTAVVY